VLRLTRFRVLCRLVLFQWLGRVESVERLVDVIGYLLGVLLRILPNGIGNPIPRQFDRLR